MRLLLQYWRYSVWIVAVGFACVDLVSMEGCRRPTIQEAEVYPYVPLWREASFRCIPEYPPSSVNLGHAGLAVVELDIRQDGTVERLSVLQAPDESIRESVRRCASQFRAAPKTLGRANRIRRGKLYFYFVSSRDRGEVFVANDPNQKARLIAARHASELGF